MQRCAVLRAVRLASRGCSKVWLCVIAKESFFTGRACCASAVELEGSKVSVFVENAS